MANLGVDGCLPIVTLFYNPEESSETSRCYHEAMILALKKVVPEGFFEFDPNNERAIEERIKFFRRSLPCITMTSINSYPGNISFFALSKYRSNSFKFFFEMISRWTTPGKRLNVVLIYASDFRLTDMSDEIYTMCEVIVRIANEEEMDEIKKNFPLIQSEIVLGIDSAFYAQRILDVKGLSSDEKTATIQENIAYIVKRFPALYDRDVFTELQHILLISTDEFKELRSSRHLSRIISVHYLFKKGIYQDIKAYPNRRHIRLKIFKTSVDRSKALGFLLCMNFLAEREAFGPKQLLKCIQLHTPNAQIVEGSVIINKNDKEPIQMLYIEVEKKDKTDFLREEILKFRKDLDIMNRIEHSHNPVFMPRNEEEIMRNIIILCDQLKYVRDIPQIQITFDHQTSSDINFTILIARILKPGDSSIAKLIRDANLDLDYFPDRIKEMGMLRKKYTKEATVFRVRLPKEKFLRDDDSIDLYKARQSLVYDISKAIGEIRDYNGGMITKQHEMLSHIRSHLAPRGVYDELLMEDFYYSLTPDVIRALIEPSTFVSLFNILILGVREYSQKGCYFRFHIESQDTFAVVICDDNNVCDKLQIALEQLSIQSSEIALSKVRVSGFPCIGLFNNSKDEFKKTQLYETIRTVLTNHYSELVEHLIR